jgi:hypothetical protein
MNEEIKVEVDPLLFLFADALFALEQLELKPKDDGQERV